MGKADSYAARVATDRGPGGSEAENRRSRCSPARCRRLNSLFRKGFDDMTRAMFSMTQSQEEKKGGGKCKFRPKHTLFSR